MKKYLLLVAAAAAMFAVSCNREEDMRVSDSQKAKVHAIDDSTPMPVVFTSQYVATKAPQIETKGLGAIDDWYGARQQLYVFGYPFKKVNKGVASYEWIDYDKPLMENVAADAPDASSDSEGIRLDGSQRAKINVYNENAVGETGDPTDPNTWEGLAAMEPYYYREDNALGEPEAFSFFGYFVDDAVVPQLKTDENPTGNLVVTPRGTAPVYNEDGTVATEPAEFGSIVLEGLILDGTQDIMLATTDKEVDALARSRYLDQEEYQTLELTDDDLGEYVEASRIYSAHAARRGINPDLIFEHQLSRVTFWIKKGGTVPSADITMAGIDLFDYYEGTLTIADGKSGLEGNRGLAPVNTNTVLTGLDFDFTAAWQAELADVEDNSHPMDPELKKFIKTVRKADDIDTAISKDDEIHPFKYDDGHYDKFGQSVLVYPGREKIDMILKIMQSGATAIGYRPYKTHLEIKNDPDVNGQPVLFEAGKNYNVYLTVYGLEEVRISVSLTEWDDAEIYLDPDADDDDLREAAQILLGTDRSVDPDGIISHVGDPVNAAYEAEDGAYLPYANPSIIPHGELTIRECDKFDLLSTQMFVKGDPDATPATEDHYEEVLAYVRSNSNGVFHFSIEGVEPTRNEDGLRVYENDDVILVEDGKITAKDVTTDPVAITVKQNSSNDFLAAVPRVIDLTIVEDDRVPVQINWNDKDGSSGNEEALIILTEEGASRTLDMNATFTIDYDKDKDYSNDVTYVLTYTNVGTAVDPVWGWGASWKIDGNPLAGPNATQVALSAEELAAYIRFDLRFEVTEGQDVIRIDPATGVITALKAGDAKVKVYLRNLLNDDTYQPVEKEIKVKVVLPQVVISNFPETLTIKYGEKYTFKPKLSMGAGAISYESATPASVSVDEKSGVILGKAVGGPVNVTITVADNGFYTGNTATCAVTVVKADPVVNVNPVTINADATNVEHTNGTYTTVGGGYTVVAPKYAAEGIDAYDGTITYESTDTGVFTVDTDGKLTAVAKGRATLKVMLAEETNYNEAVALVSVVVKALDNGFELAAAPVAATVDASGNGTAAGVITNAGQGAITLNAVTSGGVPVPSFGAKFAISGNDITLTGVAAGSYELTLRAAGDDQHLAKTAKVTINVTVAP